MTESVRRLGATVLVTVLLVSLLSLAALPGGAAAAGNATEHSSCTTISTSGVHVLTSDVTDSDDESCIEITASDVTFDGNGHVVDGVDGDDSSRGVYVPNAPTVTNVTVRNVTVTNWESGVYLDDASNGTVRNVTASNSVLSGINLYHSRNNTLRNLTVTGGDGTGIYFTSKSTDNVVKDSTVTDDAGAAVFMDSWSGDAPTNRFEDLTIGNSTAPNTTLSFTGRAVVIDQVSSPPADPPARFNASRFIDVTGIVDSSYLDLTLDYEDGDVADESSLAPFQNNGTEWDEVAGSSVDTGANELSVNLTSIPVSSSYPVSNWTTVGAFADDPSTITDCTVLDSSGVYELRNDVSGGTDEDCLEITASDVVVDGMSHTVDAQSGGHGVFVHGGVSNVTVRNASLTNGSDGVRLADADNVTVADLVIDSAGSKGVYVGPDAGNATVRNVTVLDNGDRGIVLRGPNATVADGLVESSGTRGVLVTENGDGATVADTVIRAAGTKGMRVQREATVRNVTVADATEEGINLDVDATLTVLNSTVADSGSHGIWVEPGTLTVHNSTITDSGGDGIWLTGSDTTATVVGTKVTHSIGSGLLATTDFGDVQVEHSVFVGNGHEQDVASVRAEGTPTTLVNNTVRDGGDSGFFVTDGFAYDFEDNLARNNSEHGFVVLGSNAQATFDGDAVADNGGDGFHLQGAGSGTDIDLDGTTVTQFTGKTVALSPAATTPSLPVNETSLGTFVNVTAMGSTASFDVFLPYTEPSAPERVISMWQYDGTWTDLDGDVNFADDHVSAQGLSSSSTLAVLSSPPARYLEPTITGVDGTVERGETVTVDVTVENLGYSATNQTVELMFDDPDGESRAVSVTGGGNETLVLEWATENAAPGEHVVEVRTANATASRTVTVEADDGSGGASSSAGSGDGGSDEVETITAEADDQGRATASVTAGETVRVDFGELVRNANGTTGVTQVTLDVADGGSDVILGAESLSGLPDDATPLGTDGASDGDDNDGSDGAIAYVELTATSGGADASDRLASATIRFTVDTDRLGERGLDREDVALYRFDEPNGTWTELETEVVGTTDGAVVYRATTPGFSVFAVGSRAATDDADETTTSETTGATTSASRDATTTDETTETVPAESTTTDSGGESSSGGTPGFDVAAGLLALVALVLVVGRRRD